MLLALQWKKNWCRGELLSSLSLQIHKQKPKEDFVVSYSTKNVFVGVCSHFPFLSQTKRKGKSELVFTKMYIYILSYHWNGPQLPLKNALPAGLLLSTGLDYSLITLFFQQKCTNCAEIATIRTWSAIYQFINVAHIHIFDIKKKTLTLQIYVLS